MIVLSYVIKWRVDIWCEGCHYSQCWEEGSLSSQQFLIESKLDGRVVEEQGEGVVMMRWEETNLVQRWRLTTVAEDRPGLLVNVATGRLLTIAGLSQFTAGLEEDEEGFTTFQAAGGITFEDGAPAALDRGWTTEDGAGVGVWGEHGAANQRFKLAPIGPDSQ